MDSKSSDVCLATYHISQPSGAAILKSFRRLMLSKFNCIQLYLWGRIETFKVSTLSEFQALKGD